MRILFYKIFFLSYLLTYAKSEEPHCSKYDFEEKVLEKMVRMEFQIERMKSEMEQTVKSVDRKMYEMDEKVEALQNKTVESVDRKLNEMDAKETKSSYTIKTTQEKLSEKIEALQNQTMESVDRKLNEIDEKVEALQNITVESVDQKLNEVDEKEAKNSYTIKTTQEKFGEKIEVLQNKTSEIIDTELKELQILKDQTVTPTVAFKARLNANTAAPGGQVIVFPTVLFNEGDAYSSQTGKFTATTNGTYLFTIALCVQYQKILYVDILVDGEAYTKTNIYGDGNYGCSTADTVAVLKAGQSVWVQPSSSSSGDIIYHSSSFWNTFSGVLLHK